MGNDYEQCLSDLTEALRAEDKRKFEAFFTSRGIPTASGDLGFWGGMHKMRLSPPGFTEEEREVSRQWLRENGMMARGRR